MKHILIPVNIHFLKLSELKGPHTLFYLHFVVCKKIFFVHDLKEFGEPRIVQDVIADINADLQSGKLLICDTQMLLKSPISIQFISFGVVLM